MRAFARPVFFRKQDLNVNQSQGSRIAILVDTSASMRRGDLWQQAKGRVDDVLASLSPTDEVALFFDGLDLVEPGLVRVEEWRPEPGASEAGTSSLWSAVGRKR